MYITRVVLPLIILLINFSAYAADGFRLSGSVRDFSDGEPLAGATVIITPGRHATATDADGYFSLTLPKGTYSIQVKYIGYEHAAEKVSLTHDLSVKLRPRQAGIALGEVTVTARESNGITSSSRIGRDAMAHLQPTSFTDLLELLPGGMSKDPNMTSANSIALRETGVKGATGASVNSPDYAITSLGTLFMVDGAPLNGDANLQSIGTASTDTSSPDYSRNITNKGVDMRTISTDNIESVEIVRGIPSAEYGNLTSGLVNIKRIRRSTPLTARFKADEYSKLLFVGKGIGIKGHEHVLNVDLGWLDSKSDPRNSLENYKRLTASARMNMRWLRPATVTALSVGGDFTGSYDNAKTDPDLSYNKVDEYRSDYRRTALTSDFSIKFTHGSLLKSISANASASLQNDKLTRRKQVAPKRASVAPTTMEEGVHDGQYLLSEYIADYLSEGKPVNIFVKARANGSLPLAGVVNDWKLGGEYSFSKNYGRGQVYDLSHPLSASWTTRPRAYSDIPSLQVLSSFLEEHATLPIFGNSLELQAGMRTISLVGLDSRYDLAGKVYIDPRANAVWNFPALKLGSQTLRMLVAGGWGLTTKMPTIDYLFPQNAYNDFVQLNYYDVANPTEHSRVNLRTYIDDATNYALRPARNRKWEVRFGAEMGANRLSVTYFREKMTDGFRYTSVYAPYTYRKYDSSAIDASTLTAQPSLESLPYEDVTVLDGYRKASNGTRIDKEGVEFQLNTMHIPVIATALTVTGAWFRSTYSNSQMLYATVTDVVGQTPVKDMYVGLYDYRDGRVNEQFNTNFMFDTQIPRWGLIFTTSIQCMWWSKTTRLSQNGVPVSYLSAADGELHTFTADDAADSVLQFLVKHYNDDTYKTYRVPSAIYVNLKATKSIGKHLNVAVFVNRIFDHLPDYYSNGILVRRSSDPYFGMELNFKI
jgi:hypothetical protein